MLKFYLLIFIITATCSIAVAQTDSLSAKDKELLDSMMENDEFLKLMKEKDKSYFDLNIGISNSIFSTNNNSLNAEQAETKKIFFTPSVGYYHKSGLGIVFGGYISSDSGKLKTYQYALNPFYAYSGKKIETGISYTRYISGASVNSFTVSPYKNDIYANIKLKKPWLQTGLAFGFANGKFEEYYDSTFIVNTPTGPRLVRITDTITTKLKDFSVIFSVEHEFEFKNVFGKKDDIIFTPAFLINGSTQRWFISHSNSFNNRRPIVQNLLKRSYGDGGASAAFQIQSVAFLTEATYSTGNFYLQPQLYFDYFLPSTTGKRFTTVFSVTTGFSF